jgi:RNA 2'-phosphotransferase, Tpt1 / KptA family
MTLTYSSNTLAFKLAQPMSVLDEDSSSKPSRKHRPGKGKERETFGETSSNQPRRNQSHKPETRLRGQVRDSPEVRISKTLSWLLRHGAQTEGLKMRNDGYVKVDDLVGCLSLLNYAYILKEFVLAAEPETESRGFDFEQDQGDRKIGFQATLRSYFRGRRGFESSNRSQRFFV